MVLVEVLLFDGETGIGLDGAEDVGTLLPIAFDGFCGIEGPTAECAVALTGRAAEFTSVCTLGRLLDGSGKTTALARESSFDRLVESFEGIRDGDERSAGRGASAAAVVGAFVLPAVTGRVVAAVTAAVSAETTVLLNVEKTGCGWFVVDVVPGGAGVGLPAAAVGAGAGSGTASCGSIEFAAISVVSCKLLACKLAEAKFVDAEAVAESDAGSSACPLSGACVAAFSMEYAGGTNDAGRSESGVGDAAVAEDIWPAVWTRSACGSGVGRALA